MRKVPRRLMNLNTWSPAGGAGWQIMGSCRLAGGCTHGLSGFRDCSLCSHWCLASQLPAPAAPLSPVVNILPLESQAQMNFSISCLGYDFFFCHNIRKATNRTRSLHFHTAYHISFLKPWLLECYLLPGFWPYLHANKLLLTSYSSSRGFILKHLYLYIVF